MTSPTPALPGLFSCMRLLLLAGIMTLPMFAVANSAAQRVDRQVASIDSRWAERASLRERPLQGFSTEGTRAVAWGKSGRIEKISVEALGERGRTMLDFHWRGGLLIAARERRIEYGAHIMELPRDKPPAMNVVGDERLKFSSSKLVSMRQLDREFNVSDPIAQSRARELEGKARSFKRLMMTPEPLGAADGNCFWTCTHERDGECLRYQCQ